MLVLCRFRVLVFVAWQVFGSTERGTALGRTCLAMCDAVMTQTAPDGGTAFYDAMRATMAAAVRSIDDEKAASPGLRTRPRLVIALTDGEDQHSVAGSLDALKQMVNHPLYVGVKVFVLSIGQLANAPDIDAICRDPKQHIRIAAGGGENIATAFKQVAAFLGQTSFETL